MQSSTIVFDKLLAIVTSVSIVRGLISGFQPFSYTIMLRSGLTPVEFAVIVTQLAVLHSIFSWALFIILLLAIFFLYKPPDVSEEYKRLLAKLISSSFSGLFLGGVIGHLWGILYVGEPLQMAVLAMHGLTAAGQSLLYTFGGFTVIALSYLKASRTQRSQHSSTICFSS